MPKIQTIKFDFNDIYHIVSTQKLQIVKFLMPLFQKK